MSGEGPCITVRRSSVSESIQDDGSTAIRKLIVTHRCTMKDISPRKEAQNVSEEFWRKGQ